ncbi:Bd3614 family nucleic acid deaminase [Paraburkholderia rhizosphaerae]|uniref:Cytidine/deoxycytidylate deaminase-like protein n=1 Tax=Paraburkholderia rhizosphaerae TaxID=480658 RepID=A0A4R8LUW1_9BURK|nr:Bd3614 family nucleic acid deaminase [Paraburkholderia rhizosphaerae]TDY51583.1 cytidine/deoxycytidylate deaminase-like protein [Paraburkholderia rhizosphaerae]
MNQEAFIQIADTFLLLKSVTRNSNPILFFYLGGTMYWAEDLHPDSPQTMLRLLEFSIEKKWQLSSDYFIGQFGDAEKQYNCEPVIGALKYMKASGGFKTANINVLFFKRGDYRPLKADFTKYGRMTLKQFAARDTSSNLPVRVTVPYEIDISHAIKEQGSHAVHRIYMAAAFAIAADRALKYRSDIVPWSAGKPGHDIAAVLVKKSGQIIGYAANRVFEHYLYHAERNAIEDYLTSTGEAQLPAQCVLYSTMKPCALCAGTIVSRMPQGGMTIYYGHQDSGSHADNTALDNTLFQIPLDAGHPQVPRAAKPLKTYQDAQYAKGQNLKYVDLKAQLDRNVPTPVTINLSSGNNPPSKTDFVGAADSLVRKANKYSDPTRLPIADPLMDTSGNKVPHLAVVSALIHVVEFLQSVNIAHYNGVRLDQVRRLADRLAERQANLDELYEALFNDDDLGNGGGLKRGAPDNVADTSFAPDTSTQKHFAKERQ